MICKINKNKKESDGMKTEVIKLYEKREDVTLTTYVLQDSPEMLAGVLVVGI